MNICILQYTILISLLCDIFEIVTITFNCIREKTFTIKNQIFKYYKGQPLPYYSTICINVCMYVLVYTPFLLRVLRVFQNQYDGTYTV